jgi:hypothetical protein
MATTSPFRRGPLALAHEANGKTLNASIGFAGLIAIAAIWKLAT